MTDETRSEIVSKVPQVTLLFWIIKIAATTLGETGGDAVTMTMNLGYMVGTGIFAAVFVVAVIAQIRATQFHPFIYWLTIIATTTVGTTLADFADRSLGIGYAGGSAILLSLLIASLLVWRLVARDGVGREHKYAQSRDVLLGNDLILADARDRIGRLGCRYYRSRISRRGRGVRRDPGDSHSSVFLDGRFKDNFILDRFHCDPAARCRRRRFFGQADRKRRACFEQIYRPRWSFSFSSRSAFLFFHKTPPLNHIS